MNPMQAMKMCRTYGTERPIMGAPYRCFVPMAQALLEAPPENSSTVSTEEFSPSVLQ